MAQTLTELVQAIAKQLPKELADRVACRIDHTTYPEHQPYLRRYLNSLSQLPFEVPWAVHLVLNFFLLTPAERNRKKKVDDHVRLHTFLLERWHVSHGQATLVQLLTFGADERRSNPVVTSKRFLNSFNKRLEQEGAAFTPYKLTFNIEGVYTTSRWEQIQHLLSPELYDLCTAQLPEHHALFGDAAYAIQRFSKLENQAHPFLGQLVLLAVALAFSKDKILTTKRKYFNLVAAGLPDVLEEFGIQPENFDPDDHMISYLMELGEQRAGRISQGYQEGTRAVAALWQRLPKHRDTIQAWQLRPMNEDLRSKCSQSIPENSALREQIDLVFNHWATIQCLAEARALSVRLIMSEYLRTLRQSPERSYPLQFRVHVSECNTLWEFRVWTMTSYVAAHTEFFDPQWLDRHQVTDTLFLELPESGTYSRGDDAPVKPWFVPLVGYQNAQARSREKFLEETGFTEKTFGKVASYPSLNQKTLGRLFQWVAEMEIHAGRPPPCLFEPRELWGDVLTALIQLRLIRTNGSRQHEILQLRLEKEFLSVVKSRFKDNVFSGMHWRVWLKGDKGGSGRAAVLSDRFMTVPTAHAVQDLRTLRRSTGHDPRNITPKGSSLEPLPSGHYLFHNGESSLCPQEFTRRLRFLLFGWEAFVKTRRRRHVRTHDLRHAFAKVLSRKGFTIETVAEILGHSKQMAEHYAQPTLAEQEAAAGELAILMGEAGRKGQRQVIPKLSDFLTDEPLRMTSELSPFLRNIYEREREVRALMEGLAWQ